MNESRSRLGSKNVFNDSPWREILAAFTGHGIAARNNLNKDTINIKDELYDDDSNQDEMDHEDLEVEF